MDSVRSLIIQAKEAVLRANQHLRLLEHLERDLINSVTQTDGHSFSDFSDKMDDRCTLPVLFVQQALELPHTDTDTDTPDSHTYTGGTPTYNHNHTHSPNQSQNHSHNHSQSHSPNPNHHHNQNSDQNNQIPIISPYPTGTSRAPAMSPKIYTPLPAIISSSASGDGVHFPSPGTILGSVPGSVRGKIPVKELFLAPELSQSKDSKDSLSGNRLL